MGEVKRKKTDVRRCERKSYDRVLCKENATGFFHGLYLCKKCWGEVMYIERNKRRRENEIHSRLSN
jgi:hypothetical protein